MYTDQPEDIAHVVGSGFVNTFSPFPAHNEVVKLPDLFSPGYVYPHEAPLKPVHIFYHMYCIGDFMARFARYLQSVEKSGLWGHVTLMHVVAVGPGMELARDIIQGKLTKVVFYGSEDPNHSKSEGLTLGILYDFCLKEDVYVLYSHTKGVTHPNEHPSDCWAEYMTYFSTHRAGHAFAALEHFDAVGTQLLQTAYEPHYQGNFWWTCSRYVRTLNRISTEANRTFSEMWIGGWGSELKYKLLSLFFFDVNLYACPIPKHLYENRDVIPYAVVKNDSIPQDLRL